MNKPVFYIDTDTMNQLLHSGFDRPQEEFDLIVEFTDMPYWASLRFLKTRITLTVYRRFELHTPDEKLGEFIGKATDNRKGKTKAETVPEIAGMIGPIFGGCLRLCDLMRGERPEPDRSEDGEGGLLIRHQDGEWLKMPVHGKRRPDLMVSTLFGGEEMTRPYMEDVFERDRVENLETEELFGRAEVGDIVSINELAMCSLNGNEEREIEPDPEKAAYWFRRSAEEGDPYGMFNYALHLAKGHGIPRDFSEAAEWMKKAAEEGDPDARKVSLDYRMMAINLEKAEAGDAEAQAAIAQGLIRHANDLKQAGSRKDYAEAIRWYEKFYARTKDPEIAEKLRLLKAGSTKRSLQ